nr:hypothetical protein B23L21.200 [imported] - Neurospora crassa [Neurospora crassa]
MITGWLPPGSFTVVNCSSLYFWNAGPSSFSRLGVELVRALMSESSESLESRVAIQVRRGISCLQQHRRAVRQHVSIRNSARWCRCRMRTSPGGAPSTKEDTISLCDAMVPCSNGN